MPYSSSVPRDHSDPLGVSLHLLRLEGTLYSQGELRSPWSIGVPALEGLLKFLAVTAGRCWLVIDGQDPIRMEQGSLALIPHATPHRVCSDLELRPVPLFEIPVEKVSERLEFIRHGGDGDITRTMYGCVRFDHVAADQLIRQLPEVIRVGSWDDDTGDWLRSTLRLVAREAAQMRPGGETVITRLADVVVIQALRSWLDTAPEAKSGWLSALRDPQIGWALARVHADPGADWSTDRMARAAGMSRSAFSARFSATVGSAPMAYVTRWRMSTARHRITMTATPLSVIAEEVGYRSEAAFSRAFKRQFGVSPRRFRRG